MGYNTTLLYSKPLHIVAGRMCYLYSADGLEYLDCVNNVAHVGHSHPKASHLPDPPHSRLSVFQAARNRASIGCTGCPGSDKAV